MSTENQLSISTNHSVAWNHMLDQLMGIIQPLGAQAYVEAIMLQTPQYDNIAGINIHLANKPQ